MVKVVPSRLLSALAPVVRAVTRRYWRARALLRTQLVVLYASELAPGPLAASCRSRAATARLVPVVIFRCTVASVPPVVAAWS